MKNITVEEFVKELELETVVQCGEKMKITTSDIDRVGLQLTGIFDYFGKGRVHVFGPSEMKFLSLLSTENKHSIVNKFFKNDFPCAIVCRNLEIEDYFAEIARRNNKHVFRSSHHTSQFTSEAVVFLREFLAEEIQVHGVLLDVNGVGVLLKGCSGIGKSEVALELVRRGHRLVADDAVVVRKIGHELEGSADKVISQFLEIRGVGLINITEMYGAEAIKLTQNIELVIEMEPWQETKQYDRLGAEITYEEIFGTHVQKIVVPVSPGRNLAVVVEAAAASYRLRQMGHDALDELQCRMKKVAAEQGESEE